MAEKSDANLCVTQPNKAMIFWKCYFMTKKPGTFWFAHFRETFTWSCLSIILHLCWMEKCHFCCWHPPKINDCRREKLRLSIIYCWIEAFEHGRQSIKDDARSERPRESVSPTTIAMVGQLLEDGFKKYYLSLVLKHGYIFIQLQTKSGLKLRRTAKKCMFWIFFSVEGTVARMVIPKGTIIYWKSLCR